jgi:acyl-coenzyme A thioesterase PaaI-like protein
VRPASTTPPADAVLPELHSNAPAPGTKVGSHYSKCFGCGDDVPGGLRVSTTVGEGLSVTTEFTVTENHQGAPGLAHGGLLALAFDEALGSLSWLIGAIAVTGRLETDYLRPVPVGTTLHIVARIDGVAGRKVYTSAVGRLDGPEGEVAVRATAIFVRVDVNHFLENGRLEDVQEAVHDPEQIRAARAFEVNP